MDKLRCPLNSWQFCRETCGWYTGGECAVFQIARELNDLTKKCLPEYMNTGGRR